MKIDKKQLKILFLILKNIAISSSSIHSRIKEGGDEISLVTVKRALSDMTASGLLIVSGSGPSTIYKVSALGRLFIPIDAEKYCAIEPDKRFGLDRYNFDLFSAMPVDIFDEKELKILNSATVEYEKRTKNVSATIQKKELERLIIELAWKSSKIEGNTYTLLDTEKLILENKEAVGHDKKEAKMILNHKDAFTFIRQNLLLFKELTISNLEKLHSVLVKDLNVDLDLRKKPIGITGSKYQPLDIGYQVKEAVEGLSVTISKMTTSYTKALLALAGISYVQPFEDGNKRTARFMANALLLSHGLAPLSYRSVDENEYRSAMLVFYEINSLMPVKKIFINQYEFAATNYIVK